MDYNKLQNLWYKQGVFDLMEAKYKKQFEDIDFLEYEMDMGTVEGMDGEYKSLYIGTVFNIMPSGKYYMPFACSNVSAKEALLDEIYMEVFDAVLLEHDMWLQPGEGDPCDMFVCKSIDI